MNFKTEHTKHDREEWPMFLTPDLRQKLIEAKAARVLAMIKHRDQLHTDIKDKCHGPHCECH